MDKRLLLPKVDKEGVPYLSYSQISTWCKSKREYMRQYFFGETFDGNAYTDFGTKVGEALENNDFSAFTPEEQEFLKTIPRYDQFEREIRLNFDGFYVIGYIDTNTILTDTDGTFVTMIADYKTGDIDNKIAYYNSPEYYQLEIYAAAIAQEQGYLPAVAAVYLIGRKGNAFKGEPLELTGEFATIEKEITEKDTHNIEEFIREIAWEISEYYKVFLKLNV